MPEFMHMFEFEREQAYREALYAKVPQSVYDTARQIAGQRKRGNDEIMRQFLECARRYWMDTVRESNEATAQAGLEDYLEREADRLFDGMGPNNENSLTAIYGMQDIEEVREALRAQHQALFKRQRRYDAS